MKLVTEKNNKYIIIDDFLSLEDPTEANVLKSIQDLLESGDIDFYLYDSQYVEYDKEKYKSTKQFCHHLYIHDGYNEHVSRYFNLFLPIFSKLKKYFSGYELLRAKINILSIDLDNKSQVPHFDLREPDSSPSFHWVFLYYLNDSDGDTLFFNSDLEIINRVSPKLNRAVLFDGSTLHAASNPAKTELRFVLNVDIRPDRLPIG